MQGASLSYLGQKAPRDIDKFSTSSVVDCILSSLMASIINLALTPEQVEYASNIRYLNISWIDNSIQHEWLFPMLYIKYHIVVTFTLLVTRIAYSIVELEQHFIQVIVSCLIGI